MLHILSPSSFVPALPKSLKFLPRSSLRGQRYPITPRSRIVLLRTSFLIQAFPFSSRQWHEQIACPDPTPNPPEPCLQTLRLHLPKRSLNPLFSLFKPAFFCLSISVSDRALRCSWRRFYLLSFSPLQCPSILPLPLLIPRRSNTSNGSAISSRTDTFIPPLTPTLAIDPVPAVADLDAVAAGLWHSSC